MIENNTKLGNNWIDKLILNETMNECVIDGTVRGGGERGGAWAAHSGGADPALLRRIARSQPAALDRLPQGQLPHHHITLSLMISVIKSNCFKFFFFLLFLI